MAARASLAAKRRLSLDILAASKANEDKFKVWTTDNYKETSEPASSIDLNNSNNSFPRPQHHQAQFYEKKNKQSNHLPKGNVSNANVPLRSQTSELYRTWLHRFLSWRYFIVLLLQSSFVVGMFLRNCLPMAMVCMTKPGSLRSSSSSRASRGTINESDHMSDSETLRHHEISTNVSYVNTTSAKDTDYEFDWDSEVQGLILTSIMFSTFIGPLFIGCVKDYLGNKLTMTVINILSTFLTFLSPIAARISPYCLMAVRVLLGITLGGNVAVIGDCLAWWAPNDEKLTMTALTFTGVNIGSVLAAFVSGYLCLVPLDNGWPFVFYAFGTGSLIWGLCWHFLSSHKPEEHPYISEKEKQYIISHRVGMDTPSGRKKVKPPYRKILSSIPVIAFFVTGSFHSWSTHVLFTYLPVFFNKRLQFSVQETGLLVSLTSLFRMFGSFLWTAVGNKTTSIIGINKSRKLCITLGFSLAGISTLSVGFFDETYKWLVLALLVFIMVNQSVGSSTIVALPLDIAPRYAGLLTGMFVSIASFIAISGPLLTAAITANGTHEEWQTVWSIMGTMFITGASIFLLFGHASIQSWSKGEDTSAPHVVSPFVTMGRRFSTFLEAPPLSPVTPIAGGFDYSHFQNQTTSVLSHLVATSPDILYAGHFEFDQPEMPKVVDESQVETEESNSQTGEYENDENNIDEVEVSQAHSIRKRAFSEFGLEVLKKNITDIDTVTDTDNQQLPIFEQYKPNGFVMIPINEQSNQSITTGIVNEAFTDTEGGHVGSSDDIQISRL